MLNCIKKIFSPNINSKEEELINKGNIYDQYKNVKVSKSIEDNKTCIKDIFNKSSDLIMRELIIDNNEDIKGLIVYIDNMIRTEIMETIIIEKLAYNNERYTCDITSREYYKYLLGIADEKIYKNIDLVIKSILNGQIVLFIDKINDAFEINIKNPPARNIEQPLNETVLSGPRESFTESITTNVALIRKKIKSTNLKTEDFVMGRETNTDVKIMYLSNIANPKIVNEVIQRLNKVDLDSVLDSNYIKECIEDERISNFPTIYSTEKPDVVASKILQGRIAILVD